MLVAGLVTLVQLFAIGPVGGKLPIVMGTSSGSVSYTHLDVYKRQDYNMIIGEKPGKDLEDF